ncbi:conjugal transfer protein [Lactobacillus johnsonii]|uniref:TrbC/VirB2 family protein n=1 Tax=Lactobacillus johnsonii TaxID=33959 RepID=UPI000BA40797|nr:TrbC/VirB2 family protein [Lactobacillus johnsonii]PAB56856.1 conjugal transfer protein [Lactobacillus johnsonii]PEG68822.1 conjugal transfer protein [Lactobacillus johnsonii]
MNYLTALKLKVVTGASVWNQVNNGASYASTNMTNTARFIGIAVIVAAGLFWMFGGQAAQKAKALLVSALIGGSILLLAPQLVPAIWQMFGGATF